MLIHSVASLLYFLLLIISILFQLGLVLGMPWGELTMGGYSKGVLPMSKRVGAGISAIILICFGLIIAVRIELLESALLDYNRLYYIVLAYSGIGIIANAATKSTKERNLWLPVLLVMTLCLVLLW